MSKFDQVTVQWGSIPYMTVNQARRMRDLITENGAGDILELGFFHGKSSAYFGAMLEDQGRGHLTTIDMESAKNRDPSIEILLARVGVSHRVTPIFAERSYTWEMAKMLQASPRPTFDFCYFDGGHNWDMTGFGILLVDMMLRPGGIIVVDDLDWTMAADVAKYPERANSYVRYSRDEREAKGVELAVSLIAPHLGYNIARDSFVKHWGVARKPRSPNQTAS